MCHRATKPQLLNLSILEPMSATREATAMRSLQTATREQPLLAETSESPQAVIKTQSSQKYNFF